MKKLLLSTIALICAMGTFAQFGTLPNGGMETWTTTTLYEDLTLWQTGNYEWNTSVNTTKETDAQNGNYSVRMVTEIIGTDTTFGYVLLGDFDSIPNGGFPYTTVVDTFKGWYKYDIQAGDSATILLVMFNSDTITEQVVKLVTGTQNTWTEFTMNFNAGLGTPDSFLVAAVSSNIFADTAVDGSWLMLDNLSFASSQINSPPAIPNGDFETWVDVDSEDADYFNTWNPFLAKWNIDVVRKSTDAMAGTYSMELETMSFNNGNDTTPGFATMGDIQYWGQVGGAAYTAQPDSFYFSWKYSPVNSDTAFIVIEFTNNTTLIASNAYQITGTNTSWMTFGLPLSVGSAPDTMRVMVYAGNNPGTILKVDELTLAGGNVGIQKLLGEQTKVLMYPNPAEDKVYLEYNLTEASEVTVSVYDITGKQVISAYFGEQRGEQRVSLDIGDLNTGLYFVSLIGDKETITKKLTVN